MGEDPRLQPQANAVDRTVENVLDRFSQSVSRRGMIARLGKVVLGGLGLSVATQILPVDRRVARADVSCSDWRLCNMCGNQCDCCNGDAKGIGGCPDCATVGSFWTGCCCNPNDNRAYTIRYWDCMKGSCTNAKVDQCHNCTSCSNGCPQPVWGSGTYVCTKIENTGQTGCKCCTLICAQ